MRQTSPASTPNPHHPSHSRPTFKSQSQSGSNSYRNSQHHSRGHFLQEEQCNFPEQMSEVKGRLLKGALLLREGRIKQGGELLKECEGMLEQAGDRGQEVEEGLILTLLHNLAFYHQLEWDLASCSTYLEALIYNLNRRLQKTKTASDNIKLQLSQYWLVFCGVSSQMAQHQGALLAARRSNDLVREVVRKEAEIEDNAQFFRDFLRLPGVVERNQVEQLRQTAMCLLSVWVNKCSFPNRHISSVIKKFKKHTIANAMHLSPLQKIVDPLAGRQFTQQTMVQRAITLSMSYFTIATQLRLLVKNRENSFEDIQEDNEWVESQCYHLLAVISIVHFVPFDMTYLQNVLTSYHTHYQHQLKRQHYSQLTPSEMIAALSNSSEPHPIQQQLHTFVRESLQSQCQATKEYARLNQYYYDTATDKKYQKIHKSKQSKSKQFSLKKAYATSTHSTQKTPIGRSPRNLTPNRHNQKSPKAISHKHSFLKLPKNHKKQAKFNKDYEMQSRNRQKPRFTGSKQNQALGVRTRVVASPNLKSLYSPPKAINRTLKSVSSAGRLGRGPGSKALRR